MTREEIRIRRMRRADVPTGMRFKAQAGWNQTEQDWERFLALSPQGCFVAEVGGEPVGTVVTVVFEGRCGWVAMVLVPPERRRCGIGTAMLHHGIAHLKLEGVAVVKLDATPTGRKVYLPLGFVDEYGLERREGQGQRCAWQGVRPMQAQDLGGVIALDTPAYGVNRGGLLRCLFRDSGGVCGVYPGLDGELLGYVMLRPGSDAYQIGPLVAQTEQAGRDLFCWALDQLAGAAVFFDVPLENRAGVALAEAHGFAVQRKFTRMYLGDDACGGEPAWVYATSGPEKG